MGQGARNRAGDNPLKIVDFLCIKAQKWILDNKKLSLSKAGLPGPGQISFPDHF
jgi:hypothetical protein